MQWCHLPQVVLSGGGVAAQLISKYRPPCPIVVVSDNEQVLRGLAGYYAIVPCKVSGCSWGRVRMPSFVPAATSHAMFRLLCQRALQGKRLLVTLKLNVLICVSSNTCHVQTGRLLRQRALQGAALLCIHFCLENL
jgi:pyruvate kinase